MPRGRRRRTSPACRCRGARRSRRSGRVRRAPRSAAAVMATLLSRQNPSRLRGGRGGPADARRGTRRRPRRRRARRRRRAPRRRPYRGRPRAGRHGRVEIDGSATVLSQRLEALDVSRRVHPRDLLDGRVAQRERRHQGVGVASDVARGLGDAGVHGLQARAGRSGCPRPGSWSAKRGSAPTSSTVTPFAVASSGIAATVGKAAVTAPRYPACSDETALPGRGRDPTVHARASPCRP